MRIYEIALPVRDNKGKDLNGCHLAFQNLCMIHCGGYTKRPSGEGAWTDGDGKIYYDQMIPYHIATGTEADIRALIDGALSLFPDQKAIWVSLVGSAAIFNAKPKRVPDNASATKLPLHGAGKTDGAFHAAATLSAAKFAFQQIETQRTKLSRVGWDLSEAIRNYQRGEAGLDTLDRATAQAKEEARV